ncbi:hypothetical protein HY837_03465 [archaeon]|nr:hypothetical protein [archaeon]
MKHNSIVLFFILFVALVGVAVIFASSSAKINISGKASFIESILNWIKPVTENQEKFTELPKEDLKREEKDIIPEEPAAKKEIDLSVVGTWRPYTQGIVYDAGASNDIKKLSTRRLTISEDGSWEFGSTGTWEVKQIEENDWNKWAMDPFGPTKKIVLTGWNNDIGEGPIEEGSAGVDFVWVIYHSDKLSLGPATIQIKFGH